MKFHIYNTKQEAVEAISLINKGEGIPVNEQSNTITYCEYIEHEGSYCIIADDVTVKYLGDKTEEIETFTVSGTTLT